MSQKRPLNEVDADYREFDFLTAHQTKRQKLLQHDAKEATVKKIEAIVQREFSKELCNKEAEIDLIDERINEGRRLLDRLRACIVAQHYSKVLPNAGLSGNPVCESQSTFIHPAIKKLLGKTSSSLTRSLPAQTSRSTSSADIKPRSDLLTSSTLKQAGCLRNPDASNTSQTKPKDFASTEQCRGDRFKIVKKIIVGNVSKYLAPDKKEENDKSTHKWMVYVRGPKDEPPIDEVFEKVCFFLHNSYWPNDVVEITQPPFHLTRRGWGEFQIRVQLHCKGASKKIFNISHQLKLDRTYTGLQTMGAETVVEIKLDKEIDESVLGRFSSICHDGCDSPPWQDDINLVIPEINIKQEKEEEESPESDKLITASQGSVRECVTNMMDTTSGLKSIMPAVTSTPPGMTQTETRRSQSPAANCFHSSDRGLSVDSAVSSFPLVSDAFHCPGQRSPVLAEVSLTDERKKRPDEILGSFSADNVTQELPIVPASEELCISIEKESLETCDVCELSTDYDGVHEEIVVGDTVCIEPSGKDVCEETEGNVNVVDDSISVCDIPMEPDFISNQISCDNIEEEVVVGSPVCVEPVYCDDDLTAIKSDGRVDNESVVDEENGLYSKPSGTIFQESETLENSPFNVECTCENANGTEPVANKNISTTQASDGCTQSQGLERSEGYGFVRCIDSTGRIFQIPRRLFKSCSMPKSVTEVCATSSAAAFVIAPTCGGATEQDAIVSKTSPADTCVVLPNQISAGSGTCANPVSHFVRLNSQHTLNLGKEILHMKDRKTKLGIVLSARPAITHAAHSFQNVVKRGSHETVYVIPSTCSSSYSIPKAVVVPAVRQGAAEDSKTVTTLLTSGGATEPKSSSSGIRLVLPNRKQVTNTQGLPIKHGTTVLSGTRFAVVQNDIPKSVVMRSIGLSPRRPPIILNKGRPGETMNNRDASGSVSLLTSRPPSGNLPLSNVRVLSSPGPSVLSLPVRPAVRFNHAGKSLVSFGGQVMKSLPHELKPGEQSLLLSSSSAQLKQHDSSSPVFLLVPSAGKGSHVHVPSKSVQAPAKQLVLVTKGTRDSSSPGQYVPSHVTGKSIPSIRSVKMLKGVTGNQHLVSSGLSVRHAAADSSRAKSVSILRPPLPTNSTRMSLLKRNLFARPPVSLTSVEWKTESGGLLPSNQVLMNSVPCFVSPSSAAGDETLLTTQIGNQTVVVKLQSGEESQRVQSKPSPDSKLKLTDPSIPSSLASSESLAVTTSAEKHLMFKSIRELQKPPTKDAFTTVDLEDVETMEDLVRTLVKRHPLYRSNVDRSVHPYCAPSWNAFLQWNVGKRRAAELCRAVAVLKKISLCLNHATTFRGEPIWSKFRLITWCRHNLFTPLDNEMRLQLKEDCFCKPEFCFSLTSHREVVSQLDSLSRTVIAVPEEKEDDDELPVDIISLDDLSEEKRQQMKRSPVKVMTGAEIISPSTEALFVREVAGKIGIRFSPVPVLPSECPDVLSSTAEEMIAAVTCAFAEQLMRTACATLFRNRRNPLELDVSSIYHSLLEINQSDFLTNRSLGVLEEELNPS